jgi:flagellar hook-basal body complex protein FliE
MDNTSGINQVLAQMRVLAAQARESVPAQPAGDVASADFAGLLKQSIEQVNDFQQRAAQSAEAFERGEAGVDLAQVMVGLQKAIISFQAMTQVRNRLISAYQDVMNMPI